MDDGVYVKHRFGFSAETDNNCSFGVVLFLLQKTRVSFGYGRNYYITISIFSF